MGLYNGEKPVAQLCGFHDLYTANEECGVLNTDRDQIKSRSLHERK